MTKTQASIGDLAPEFTLLSQDNQPVTLTDFRGQWLALYFYPKDDTPICTKEACAFRDAYGDLKALNTAVIGVSADSPESHRRFADTHKLPFTLLSDTDRRVHQAYGVKKQWGILPGRVTFLIDPNGVIRHRHAASLEGAGHLKAVLEMLKDAHHSTT